MTLAAFTHPPDPETALPITRVSATRVRFSNARSSVLVALSLATACSHTAPPATIEYGADSPFTSTPYPLLARNVSTPAWSVDGKHVFLAFGFRAIASDGKRAASDDGCLGTVPATGGSIRNPVCNHRSGYISYLASPAVDASGRWLYTESVKPDRYGYPFPVGWRADLWLGQPHNPSANRVRLLTLYRDDIGRPTVPPTTINWLSDVAWSAGDTFVAKGYNLRPDNGSTLHGIVHGRITDTAAMLSVIAGTSGAIAFAVASGGAEVIAIDAIMQVSRIDISSGAASSFRPVPALPGRKPIGIGCRPRSCVITTTSSDSSNVEAWTWVVGEPAATLGGLLPPGTSAALPSPVNDQLLVTIDETLYVVPFDMP